MAEKKDFGVLLSNHYRLLALDVDGTLITSDHILTRRTFNAINNIKKLGIKVTIATGRHYKGALRLARKMRINAPLISSDGAVIKDINSNSAVYNLLPVQTTVTTLEMASHYKDFRLLVFTREGKVYSGVGYRLSHLKRFFCGHVRYSLTGYFNFLRDFVLTPVKNMGTIHKIIDVIKEPPAKVVIYGSENTNELRDYKEKVLQKFGDSISITSGIPNCIDILDGGISKAKGISIISEELNIPREEVIAVGDNINDIEMIEYAGLGVAMGNAPEKVKDKADYVTTSNNDDGLARFLENLLEAQSNIKTM